MDFNVRNVSGEYSEFLVHEGNTTIETGLLIKQEAKDLAEKLIMAGIGLMTKQDMAELLRDNFDKEDLFGEGDV